jgi:hypothetical protein
MCGPGAVPVAGASSLGALISQKMPRRQPATGRFSSAPARFRRFPGRWGGGLEDCRTSQWGVGDDGGARENSTKCTPEIKEALEQYLDENCTYTLQEMCDMPLLDFGVRISPSTASRHLCGALYTMKKVCVAQAMELRICTALTITTTGRFCAIYCAVDAY